RERWSHRFGRLQEVIERRRSWIGDKGSAHEIWCNFFEHRQPFAGDALLVLQQAGEIAAWPRQTRNETRTDRVGNSGEDDRDRAGLWLHGCGSWCRLRDDHVGLQRDQFSREQTGLCARGRKAIVDAQITTFRPSKLLKSLTESREALLHLEIILGEANQHADAPHALRLLRPRSERPRCYRTTEQRYKIAPFHCLPVAQDRASYRFKAAVGKARLVSALGHKRTFCDAGVMSALPPKADSCSAPADVCFVPKADIAVVRKNAGTSRL